MANTIELIAKLRDHLSGPLGRTGQRMQNFGRTAARAGVMVGVLATAVVAAAKKLADYGAAIQDMSDFSGVGVEALQGLVYGVEQAGGSAQNLSMAFRTQAKFIGYLEQGLSSYTQYLDDLGLTYEDLAGLSAEETFLKLSDALGRVQDDVRQTEIGMVMFGGRGMSSIMSAMEQFDGSLRNAQDQFEELGYALSEEQVAGLKTYSDAMTDLEYRFRGFLADSIVPMLPAMQDMADKFMDAAETAIPKLVQVVKDSIPIIMGMVDVALLVADGWKKIMGGDAQEEVDRTAESFGQLASVLETQVHRGQITATEAAITFNREMQHFIEGAGVSEMEALYLRNAMMDLGGGFDIARRALNELLGSVYMTEQFDRVAGAVQTAGQNIVDMLVDTGALTAEIERLANLPVTIPGSGTAEDRENFKSYTEFRKELELALMDEIEERAQARHEAVMERKREEYQARTDAERELADEQARIEEERMAAIQAQHEAMLDVIRSGIDRTAEGLGILAVQGSDAAAEWGKRWLEEIQQLLISSAVKAFLNVITGGIGGSIFGFLGFQSGGVVRHAQTGEPSVVPGTGYQDKVPYMLAPGEGVYTREQMQMGGIGNQPGRVINVSLIYSPTLSTASPGEAVKLASEVGRILGDGGYI